MTASDISSWTQTGILLLTLITTIVISWLNYRKADAAERRAQASSDMFADGLDDIAQSIKGLATASAPPRKGVRWELTWESKSVYRLENIGDEPAHNVSIRSHETLPTKLPEGLPKDRLEPSEGIDFAAIRTMQTQDASITVSWTDSDGRERTWSRTLPFGL